MAYPNDDLAPPGYQVYPGSTPEFRMYTYADGRTAMQVHYVCKHQGYSGLWMDVETVKAPDA